MRMRMGMVMVQSPSKIGIGTGTPVSAGGVGKISIMTKLTMMENLLYIVDKQAQLKLLKLNMAQRLLFSNWTNQILLTKSRQLGVSTAVLGYYFIEAQIIPGLVVAIVSHEDFATRRLIDKIDTFHSHLPEGMKSKMVHDSDNEKLYDNGSTIYIGTAGSRAFGRGDTVHRALVSEEAHYVNAEKLLSGLREAVPMDGTIVRESTPLGDSGYYYKSVRACIEKKSDYRLVPLYWWYGEDYRIPRGSEIVMEQERGELGLTKQEIELMLEKGLDEEQIRWRRWKVRNMVSENKGNLFPQEYIEDLETCWLGTKDRVMGDVEEQLARWSLRAREPLRIEGMVEIWKEPEVGQRYIFWVDPAGGEGATEQDPHDGVILRVHPGGLEHVLSIRSWIGQKELAYKVVQVAQRYNTALLVVERNGVGKGVLNYLVNDIAYGNLYHEKKENWKIGTGKPPIERWGWNTDHANKALIVSDTIEAVKNDRVVSYDRSLIGQLRGLIYRDGKIEGKDRDDRAIAFCGAVSVAGGNVGVGMGRPLAVGEYATWKANKIR